MYNMDNPSTEDDQTQTNDSFHLECKGEIISELPNDINLSKINLREKLLDSVVNSKARFKNEQLGEPELNASQKHEIATKILEESPGTFLARFGTLLSAENLQYFKESDNYEVRFYLQQLDAMKKKTTSKTVVKNRRYEALKKLVDEGNYFSETEMRRRNPLLYEQLIGQYLSEEELNEINSLDMKNITLLALLLEHMDRDETRSLRLQQQMQEECAMEESDEDSEYEEDGQSSNPTGPVSDEEKTLLRHEFVSHMYRNFLEGKDADFDYISVDQNAEYDNIEVLQRDAEDSYFDSETPEAAAMSVPDSPMQETEPAEEEDELDAYMQTLPPVVQQVDSFKQIGHGSRR